MQQRLGEQIAEARERNGYPKQTDAAKKSVLLERQNPEKYKSFSQQRLSVIEDTAFTAKDLEGIHRGRVRSLEYITGLDLGSGDSEPPSSLEDRFEGIHIPIYGKVSAGSDEPEPMEGESLGIPNYILKSLQIREPQRELAGYLVNGNSMFYASDGARARGLKHGDFIAVQRFATPREGDMVVIWDRQNEKMLVKLFDETEEWLVFRSVNSSANPPITRRRDDVHVYGVVVFKAGRP